MDTKSDPAVKWVKVVDGQSFAPCVALLVGTEGTATVTSKDGVVSGVDMPLQKGFNPLSASKVVFGSASNIWALYNKG